MSGRTGEGVDVRNFFGSRFILWQEIERFTIGRFQLLPAVCVIVLQNGDTYHAGAIQASEYHQKSSSERGNSLG